MSCFLCFWIATTEEVRPVLPGISEEATKFSKNCRIYCLATSMERDPVRRESTECRSQRDLHLNTGSNDYLSMWPWAICSIFHWPYRPLCTWFLWGFNVTGYEEGTKKLRRDDNDDGLGSLPGKWLTSIPQCSSSSLLRQINAADQQFLNPS